MSKTSVNAMSPCHEIFENSLHNCLYSCCASNMFKEEPKKRDPELPEDFEMPPSYCEYLIRDMQDVERLKEYAIAAQKILEYCYTRPFNKTVYENLEWLIFAVNSMLKDDSGISKVQTTYISAISNDLFVKETKHQFIGTFGTGEEAKNVYRNLITNEYVLTRPNLSLNKALELYMKYM